MYAEAHAIYGDTWREVFEEASAVIDRATERDDGNEPSLISIGSHYSHDDDSPRMNLVFETTKPPLSTATADASTVTDP